VEHDNILTSFTCSLYIYYDLTDNNKSYKIIKKRGELKCFLYVIQLEGRARKPGLGLITIR
jgi:hypothetical protein